MQKIKNLLHHNRDANHNGIPDSQERTITTSTTSTTSTTGLQHNPLDRNFDGKADLHDITGNPVPAQNLQAKRTLHQELLGRGNSWNLRSVQPTYSAGLSGFDQSIYGMNQGFNNSSNWSNDRNMNGIPDNLESSQFVSTRAPVNIEQIQKDVVVHEHIHPVEKEEIQPVIYREREQLDIKQVTQQLHETQIQPTFIQTRELAPEYREAVVQRGAPIQENIVLPSVDRDATMRSQVVHAPIVNEVVKKTVVEEIQPVLERDIIQSTLIQETKPIYEKVIEAPVVYRETTVIQDRGINGGSLEGLSAQGFNLGTYSNSYSSTWNNDKNMNGIPDNLERTQGFNNSSNWSNDRNMNGIPDNLERSNWNDKNMNGIPDSQEGSHRYGAFNNTSNDLNNNGIPDNMERRNPLDRNMDGRVDLKDLTGRPGYAQQQQGFGAKTANPLDRNNDGKVNLQDLTGQPSYAQAPLRTL